MSHPVDECYECYEITYPRARKPHECCACHEAIRVGDLYARVFVLFDGEKTTYKRCLRCQEMHGKLADILRRNEEWPDEELNCGETYDEHHGEPAPPELARLAFLSPDDAQAELGKDK